MDERPGTPTGPSITVILGPFSSAPFALGLRALILEDGDFDVITVDDPAVLDRNAVLDRPSVLVAEGADPAMCLAYLDTSVVRSVVLFDPVGTRAFVGMDNPDWRRLAAVIRAAADEVRTGPPVTAGGRVRVVDPRALPAADAHGADSVAMAPLIEWLELSLGRALVPRIEGQAPSVPGWSLSPLEALDLLRLEPRSRTEEELLDRLRAADDTLIGSRAALPRALAQVAEVFDLSEVELRLVCLLLAPELDGRYATVVGVLQDDLTRRRPGLTLLAELMPLAGIGPWDLRRILQAPGSVVAKGLVHAGGPDALPVDAGLAPSRALLAHLVAPSSDRAVADVQAELRRPAPDGAAALSAEEAELAARLRERMAARPAAVHLLGGDRAKGWFGRLAGAIGLPLVVGDLEAVEPGPGRTSAVGDWAVTSRLVRGGLVVLGVDALGAVERRQVGIRLAEVARGARLVAVDGLPPSDGSWWRSVLPMHAPTISTTQRAAWWSSAAARSGIALGEADIRRLAATAPVDPEHIDRSVAVAAGHRAPAGVADVVELQRTARALSPVPLPLAVRQVTPVYGWKDIVLPGPRKELLQAIPLHVLQTGRVLEEWGFAARIPYGQGVAALFSGPSGTGKTMSAQIIAGSLGVDLLQVDLSKTISKYIGETEKNLDQIFDAAEGRGAVLLFDEADAVFGRRTEIKDAHDRHANVEVAYLLQRVESFRGLAILTTNFQQNIDDAFVRRLRFVVEFALPTASERLRIWHKAFPADAPRAADVDFSFYAARLQIPGGSIQNIALHAAFLAAADGGEITAAHLLAATRRELIKIGMLTAERSLDELAATS